MAWERLAHFALSTAGDTIDTADDTSFSGNDFTAKKSLRVLVHIQDSGTCNVKMRFNGFADQSYSTKYAEGGANDGSSTSATFIRCYEVGSGTDVQRQMTFEITNISDKEKHILGHTVESESTGASSIPKRVELAGKFDKTNQQITRIQLVNDATGSFGAGSYITVLGAKEPATADSISIDGGDDNTATFTDDFSSDNWTDRGSNVGVSGGTITWSNCAMGADNGTSRSITALSDTKWVMRFKFTPTAMNIPNQWIMWAVDQVGNPDSTAQDGIGVVLHDTYKLRLGTKTDSTAYYNQGASGDIMSSTLSNNTTYYIELARTSTTNARLRYFSDENYSTQIDSDINVTITSSISGLDNLSTGVQSGGNSSRTMSATLDDLKIYNGVSSVRKGMTTTKKNYRLEAHLLGANTRVLVTFNEDGGSVYSYRFSANGASDSEGNVAQTSFNPTVATSPDEKYLTMDISNDQTNPKFVNADLVDDDYNRMELTGKYANSTDLIDKIKITNNDSGSFAEGSEMILWGSDGASDTTYPTLVGGYVFEESDTGKHFMYDGTNTWTEIS